jgi:sulfate permease, SulP family
MSVLLLVYRASRPNVAVLGRTAGPDPAWVDLARHPAAERTQGVEVVRVEAGLFFANADHVRARIRRIAQSGDARAVVLDAETTPPIDVTGAQMLADLAQDLRRQDTDLLIAHDLGQVRDVLQRAEVPGIAVGVVRVRPAAAVALSDRPCSVRVRRLQRRGVRKVGERDADRLSSMRLDGASVLTP